MSDGFAPATFGPVTRTDLVRYAGASGDFNPLHHDPDAARRAGFADVIAHGMYTAGLVAAELDRRWGPGALLSYAVRFHSPVHLGDVLTLTCTQTLSDASDSTVEVGLTVTRAAGETVMTARARLPQALFEGGAS